jgi:hypothetical protein
VVVVVAVKAVAVKAVVVKAEAVVRRVDKVVRAAAAGVVAVRVAAEGVNGNDELGVPILLERVGTFS